VQHTPLLHFFRRNGGQTGTYAIQRIAQAGLSLANPSKKPAGFIRRQSVASAIIDLRDLIEGDRGDGDGQHAAVSVQHLKARPFSAARFVALLGFAGQWPCGVPGRPSGPKMPRHQRQARPEPAARSGVQAPFDRPTPAGDIVSGDRPISRQHSPWRRSGAVRSSCQLRVSFGCLAQPPMAAAISASSRHA
jgi:hypothetical protein